MDPRVQLLEKVQKQVDGLSLWSPKDLDEFMLSLEFMPVEALQRISALLDEAEEKQKDILRKLNKKNPNFNTQLKESLQSKFQEIGVLIHKEEGERTELLLKQI